MNLSYILVMLSKEIQLCRSTKQNPDFLSFSESFDENERRRIKKEVRERYNARIVWTSDKDMTIHIL